MASPVGCPVDLRRLVGEGILARLVLESVSDQAVQDRMDGCCGRSANGLPSAILLTLLTYNYAACCYGSTEIEEGLRRDDVPRYLAADCRPQRDDLRQFRRRCRSELRRCLADVLRRVSAYGIDPEDPGDAGLESQLELSVDRWRTPGFDPRFEIEADARIALAMQTDSYAMDEW
jgi:hypothetical protein